MKLFIATIAIISFAVVYAVLEENKLLIKELEAIEKAQRECAQEKPTEKACSYKYALEKLNYLSTAVKETESYRNFCEQNVTTIENECEKSQEFVYCLHSEVQNEVNTIRDKCVDEFKADMKAFRNLHTQSLIEDQGYACFMFCFQKGVGKMNEDLTFNFDDEQQKKSKFKIAEAVEECAKSSELEVTKCSKAAHRVYCLENKFHG